MALKTDSQETGESIEDREIVTECWVSGRVMRRVLVGDKNQNMLGMEQGTITLKKHRFKLHTCKV